ncbi:hypothetical protein B0J14DRAFT_566891 [Halenospora varia]|nr:hypothetical protein B0J14DRAFT_566891 [Halenospora varia]
MANASATEAVNISEIEHNLGVLSSANLQTAKIIINSDGFVAWRSLWPRGGTEVESEAAWSSNREQFHFLTAFLEAKFPTGTLLQIYATTAGTISLQSSDAIAPVLVQIIIAHDELPLSTSYDRNVSNPLLLPEIVGMVVDNVHMVPDLLSCACVNGTWSVAALKKLYKGSLNDMQFRTPDIGSLNCLFVASRERNIGFVKHLLLSPESPAIDEAALPDTTRLVCTEKCGALRLRLTSAELLLRPQGEGLASLTIPFEIEGSRLVAHF